MIIYKITNLKNNKIYIGLTTLKSAQCRFTKHVSEAKNSTENRYFLNAINKYGKENFKIEEIDFAYTIEELKQKEINYIKLLRSTDRNIGYNLSEGGDGTPGVLKSKETRDKIRQKALGRKVSEKTKEYMSNLYKGKKAHPNTLLNIQKHNLNTSKKIEQYDEKLNLIKTFNSIGELVKSENVDRSGISQYINSNKFENRKMYKGFLYKIKE